MTRAEAERQLRARLAALEAPFVAARDRGDQAEMDRLQGIADEIDILLDEVVLLGLTDLVARVSEITARIDQKKAEIDDFNSFTLVELTDKLKELLTRSSESDVPPPSAQPLSTPARNVPVTAEPPGETGGSLVLTEAHLIALWRRSLFPIDDSRITVFGLRGCRPISFGGTGFGPQQEIAMTPVDYLNMNCTLGQWKPGIGMRVFPGSTVPFGSIVKAAVGSGGTGVNRMGRGRMKRYRAGWHKRREAEKGHWALLQECPITIQRTSNDAIYDDDDPWDVGRIAGDNIHCAFHMGVDGNIPNAPFSSAGCQTVAGTVEKGKPRSEVGPWKDFIEPFAKNLGTQKECEYVLFDAEEARMMIRTQCAGKTVVLRFGSQGPLVKALQKALNKNAGANLVVDGDFGPGTFRAVVDFQDAVVGSHADDGIVGPATAERLGFELPAFDFANAIGGGSGFEGPSDLGETGEHQPSDGDMTEPVFGLGPDDPIAFGALARNKHGQAFNRKVILISKRLGCDPNHLMAVMAFETGQTFATDELNNAGSGATGLIQFMPATARGLGTTTEELAKMSGVDQLDYVEKHIAMHSKGKLLASISDVYMTVLLPSAVGKPESHVLFRKPSKAYSQNQGLDRDEDGNITKAEASSRVAEKLVIGMRPHNLG